jgi:hypothetical protein
MENICHECVECWIRVMRSGSGSAEWCGVRVAVATLRIKQQSRLRSSLACNVDLPVPILVRPQPVVAFLTVCKLLYYLLQIPRYSVSLHVPIIFFFHVLFPFMIRRCQALKEWKWIPQSTPMACPSRHPSLLVRTLTRTTRTNQLRLLGPCTTIS